MTTPINLRECVCCGNSIKSGHIQDNKEYCESCYKRKFNQEKPKNSKPSSYDFEISPDILDYLASNAFSRDNTNKECEYLGCDLPVFHNGKACVLHECSSSFCKEARALGSDYCHEHACLFEYYEPKIDKETKNNFDLQLDSRHVTMLHTSESILAVGIGPLILFGFILFWLNDWNSYEKHHWIISYIFCGFYLPFVAGIRFIERFSVAFWPMLMWYCIFLGGALFLFSWILPWEVCYPLAYIVGILPWLLLMSTNSSNYR